MAVAFTSFLPGKELSFETNAGIPNLKGTFLAVAHAVFPGIPVFRLAQPAAN